MASKAPSPHTLDPSPGTARVQVKQSPLLNLQSSAVIHITNSNGTTRTHQPSTLDLKSEILAGLRSPSPSLPSLLLWGDNGIRHFNNLTLHPNYYPSRTELAMITQYAEAFASMTPAGGILLELGCGNLHKTSIILSAFHHLRRPINYYALDVSEAELHSSVKMLRQDFAHSQFISINGLYGTYDDCGAWLLSLSTSSPPYGLPNLVAGQVISFLWIGNSIANMHPSEATEMLCKFQNACSASQLQCQFLIGSDACDDPAAVLKAYNPSNQVFNDFILSGLDYANDILGGKVFRREDFQVESKFDSTKRLLSTYYVTNKRVELDWDNHACRDSARRFLEKGERVCIIFSYKWSVEGFSRICENAGMQIARRWTDKTIDYSNP
ncbi:hypothetical protein EYZ11_009398 [Aspergillus tanneri]|uniref:Histidine-specific methyltransferase SAM-dependent domain-containing protein n=1 Tax=Aspergillus tanneri TaxID=1220188 RepID=A0A4S3JA54_9EURO|nr:uncharacterized protein ATNIH1004_002194 [Aspergillus tanneri]KAA8649523.1 hypothetical protein ATNIH1004_002194 [Aspergillus tanneri]THC91148.1 hypothetical protein EYZ11_009398 [Aspergillus tanneri]